MSLIDQQKEYYQRLLAEHGTSPQALAYRDMETQDERFVRMERLWEHEAGPYLVHEIGCGLGHMGEYIRRQHPLATYSGTDVLDEFVEHCRKTFTPGPFFNRDVIRHPPADRYDFVVLSGTFNGRLETSPAEWQTFIHDMMAAMYRMCTKAIGVNFLTSYADPEFMKGYLHYQPEADIFDYSMRNLSRHVELDMGGPLYEYTLRIYRPEYVRQLYPTPPFDRYFRKLAAKT